MKKILTSIIFLVIFSVANAQDNANQNPNYKQSMDFYQKQKNELQQDMNTTMQSTYKAFDWYTNKQEKRNERINFRRQIRFARASAPVYYNQPFNNFNGCNNNNWRFRNQNNWWCW